MIKSDGQYQPFVFFGSSSQLESLQVPNALECWISRPGIHESHVGYYYNRCFRKALNPKLFGVTTITEVCVARQHAMSIRFLDRVETCRFHMILQN